jgi:hypothetical protein
MRTRRPDLEALPFKSPGFIAGQLFPFFTTAQKTGTLYFDDIVSDGTAETTRSLAAAATASRIDSASTSFTCAEIIKRYKIDDSEILLRGGLDAAQAKMARHGKRAIMDYLEAKAVAATFGDIASISNRDILTSFLQALDVAKEAVQDYGDGKVAVFGAQSVISRLKRYDEVVDRMKHTGVLVRDIRDVRSISNEQLAAALDVDMILPGPSTPWLGSDSAYDGYVGVCLLPDENVDPDEAVQLGRTIVYEEDGLYRVETYYSDDLISEVCDTRVWANMLALNKECCYILRGVDEGNANTTTTTTTAAG